MSLNSSIYVSPLDLKEKQHNSVDDSVIISNYLKVLEFGEKYSGCSKVHLGAGLFSKDDSYEPILGQTGWSGEAAEKKNHVPV